MHDRAYRLGVVVVPMNWRLSPSQLLDIAIEAQADGIVVDPSLAHLAADVIPQLDPQLVITLGEEYEAWLRGPWPEPVPVAALLTIRGVAAGYSVEESHVKGVYWNDDIRAAKVSLMRWSSSSDPFCSNLFGSHLHTPLAVSDLISHNPKGVPE
jgi:hypothetical protein